MLRLSENAILQSLAVDQGKTTYCSVTLDDESYKAFVYAIKNNYWYQMYLDDLPIWGMVGDIDTKVFFEFIFINLIEKKILTYFSPTHQWSTYLPTRN